MAQTRQGIEIQKIGTTTRYFYPLKEKINANYYMVNNPTIPVEVYAVQYIDNTWKFMPAPNDYNVFFIGISPAPEQVSVGGRIYVDGVRYFLTSRSENKFTASGQPVGYTPKLGEPVESFTIEHDPATNKWIVSGTGKPVSFVGYPPTLYAPSFKPESVATGGYMVLKVPPPSSAAPPTVSFQAAPPPTVSFQAAPPPTVSFQAAPPPTVSFQAAPTQTSSQLSSIISAFGQPSPWP